MSARGVLITGAGGGIGAAAAKRAAARGWSVHLGWGRRADSAEALARELSASGAAARALRLPLDDDAGIDRALVELRASGAELDGLILCASPAPSMTSFLKTSSDDILAHARANAAGAQRLIAGVWSGFLRRRGGGHVVATSSAAASRPPQAHMTSYVVGKRAQEAVLECALAELGSLGLRASVLNPGFVDTPMFAGFHPHVQELIRAALGARGLLSADEVGARLVEILESPPAEAALAVHSLPNR